MKVVVSLVKDVLAPLATMASVSAKDGAIKRKLHGRGVVRTWKGIKFSHFEWRYGWYN